MFVLGGETVPEQEHSKADDGGDQQADSSGDCSGGGHALQGRGAGQTAVSGGVPASVQNTGQDWMVALPPLYTAYDGGCLYMPLALSL